MTDSRIYLPHDNSDRNFLYSVFRWNSISNIGIVLSVLKKFASFTSCFRVHYFLSETTMNSQIPKFLDLYHVHSERSAPPFFEIVVLTETFLNKRDQQNYAHVSLRLIDDSIVSDFFGNNFMWLSAGGLKTTYDLCRVHSPPKKKKSGGWWLWWHVPKFCPLSSAESFFFWPAFFLGMEISKPVLPCFDF